MFVDPVMRASSHDLDARFLIIFAHQGSRCALSELFVPNPRGSGAFLDCHVVTSDRLETLALVTVPDTDLTHMLLCPCPR